jgi:hypothetical protein
LIKDTRCIASLCHRDIPQIQSNTFSEKTSHQAIRLNWQQQSVIGVGICGGDIGADGGGDGSVAHSGGGAGGNIGADDVIAAPATALLIVGWRLQ